VSPQKMKRSEGRGGTLTATYEGGGEEHLSFLVKLKKKDSTPGKEKAFTASQCWKKRIFLVNSKTKKVKAFVRCR